MGPKEKITDGQSIEPKILKKLIIIQVQKFGQIALN